MILISGLKGIGQIYFHLMQTHPQYPFPTNAVIKTLSHFVSITVLQFFCCFFLQNKPTHSGIDKVETGKLPWLRLPNAIFFRMHITSCHLSILQGTSSYHTDLYPPSQDKQCSLLSLLVFWEGRKINRDKEREKMGEGRNEIMVF